MIQIPEATRATCGPLSMFRLLAAAGIHPAAVASWSFLGTTYEAHGGANPLLSGSLPALPAGDDGSILVHVRSLSPAPVSSRPAGHRPHDDLLAAMKSDWQAILQNEASMGSARQQLLGLQQRINSLNRDMPPELRSHADSADKREWHDARRWMRDAASHVSRDLRNHDIGVTSNAGARSRFEQVYNDFVVSNRPFEGLPQAQKDFETHRKTTQLILTAMQQTIVSAARDGELRAQQVLSRIAGKLRRGDDKKRRG